MTDELPGDEAVRAPAEGQLEREKAYFGPSEAAPHPFCVLYQGEYETLADGTAIAVRRHARALADAGIPVQLRSFSNMVVNKYGAYEPAHLGISETVEHEVDDLRKNAGTALVPMIKHAVLQSAEHTRNVLVPRGVIGLGGDAMVTVQLRRAVCANTILYTVWERDRIDEEWARELSRAAQLWVPCGQNAEMLAESGVPPGKIHVVPHPYREQDDLLKLVHRKPNTEWRLFYSIGRWEPRKAYAELIQAFLLAFTPADRVVLTIKYSGNGQWQDYPTPEEAVQRALAHEVARANGWNAETAQQRVQLLSKHLTPSGIVELHYRNNIYVAASHGEAWNFGAFDAKISGNAMVYTGWGGMTDYAAEGDPCVACGMEPVHASYGWGSDAQWATVDVMQLAFSLAQAQAPERYQRPANFDRFSSKAVGAQMRELVLQLADQNNPDAAAYYREAR